jgi:ribose-phosphate pyrophosphokinase
MFKSSEIKLFSGTANPELSAEIAAHLKMPLGNLKISHFSDGEIYAKFEESVRGRDVYVIQPTCPPVDSNLVELLILLDALRRASAGRITAVIPYYGYARQEKKDAPREPITAKLIADILTTAGANRAMTVELHAPAIQGFFNIPVDHLTTQGLFVNYFQKKEIKDLVVVSPDEGGAKKVRKIANKLDAPLAIGYKYRPEHMKAELTHLAGDVKGKTPLIVDDMITSGGSIVECVRTLLKNGCNPEIYVAATHGILTSPEKLQIPEIKEVVLTNTAPLSEEKRFEKLKVLSVAPILGEAILRAHNGESISSLFV